jgi:hypothetical protein
MLNDYTKAAIKRIKDRAVKQIDKPVISVSHITPRAYCIAKPAPHCAVFAIPLIDREKYVRNQPNTTVQNESCAHVQMGDWATLAYVVTSSYGQPIVVKL